MDGRLRSEREGRSRNLSLEGLAVLLWKQVIRARTLGLFDQSLLGHLNQQLRLRRRPEIYDAEEYFLLALHTDQAKDIAGALVGESIDLPFVFERSVFATAQEWSASWDLLLDLLELLHDKLVGLPQAADDSGYPAESDRAAGQAAFRNLVNPVLAMHGPPLELLPLGHIVDRDPERRSLYVKDLPEHSERQLAEPVNAAKHLYLKRGATVADKRAAVQALAGALEHLRTEVKTAFISKDEAALFELANGFAIRHNNRGQKIDYDAELWLDWMFHVYLATVQAVVGLRRRQYDLKAA